ncbi:MAG: rhombosortase [Planctomycetota bacterium]|nr:rhombosortase [Planctomycetota bacterium]
MMATRSVGIGRWAKNWPTATFLGTAAAVLVFCMPGLAVATQLQTANWMQEPWRMITAHFAHFSPRHFIYDLIVFAGLGLVCERRWPLRTRWALALSTVAIPVAFLATTHLETYRGLSGLGSALMVLLTTRLHVEGAFRSHITKWLPPIAGLAFLAKLLFEVITGQSFFVAQDSIFDPVPIAHLVGGLIGFVAALTTGRASH